jgi:hypothetical protein
LPLIFALFVFWLALHGRLGMYAGFATSGPGWNLPSIKDLFNGTVIPAASKAVGGTGTPNVGYQNPVLYPSTVAKGQNQVQNTSSNPPLSQSPPSSSGSGSGSLF